jgi:hypothetical protein
MEVARINFVLLAEMLVDLTAQQAEAVIATLVELRAGDLTSQEAEEVITAGSEKAEADITDRQADAVLATLVDLREESSTSGLCLKRV